ncbi:hypothetical protein ACFLQT_01315 [Bacteroidota bacterium]
MKKFLPFTLFFIFAGLLLLNNKITDLKKVHFPDDGNYYNGLLETELNNVTNCARYNISVDLYPEDKYISVSEDIIWFNTTNIATNEIHVHLYANAYKSNNTLFTKDNHLAPESFTEIEIKDFLVENKHSELIYIQPDINNQNDSTAAKVILTGMINPGDSVNIHFEYKLKIPRSVTGIGYATGRNFFFISEWFPKIGVFENGEWTCRHFHSEGEIYSDLCEYSVDITVPNEYFVASSGKESELKNGSLKTTFRFEQTGIHDFVWAATDEIIKNTYVYQRSNGTEFEIGIFIQPEKEKFKDRYISAINNAMKYLEEKIGQYPYSKLTFIDAPRTWAAADKEYPSLLTLHTDLFSGDDELKLEHKTIHGLTRLYFNSLFSINRVDEAWLGDGLAYYTAEKIMAKYYDKRNISFRLAKYFPIYGLNFLTHYEIPLIYTLGIYKYNEESESVQKYLMKPFIGRIADKSFNFPTKLSYEINTTHKPHLMLLSLERIIGVDSLLGIFKKYYDEFRYEHPRGEDFINLIERNSERDLSWFFENIYKTNYFCDYKLNHVKQINDNEYEVFAERSGKGIFECEIALYTDMDTLFYNWDTDEEWKKIIFKTENEVLAAEIDPDRKNVMDLNYANNSYAVGGRYFASFTLALRVFFWIQNALLILGAIG